MNSWTLGLRDLDQSLGCISNKNDTIWEQISASTLCSHSHWDKNVVENCLCTFGARFCSEEIFKASNLSENVIVMFDETTPSTKTHQRDIRPDLPVAAKVMARGNINQRVVRTWQSGLVQRIFPLGLDIGILGNLNISLLCFLFPRTTTNIIRQFSIIFTYFCSSGYTVLQAFSYGHWLCTPRFKQMTVCSMCSVCLATAAGLFFGQLL